MYFDSEKTNEILKVTVIIFISAEIFLFYFYSKRFQQFYSESMQIFNRN